MKHQIPIEKAYEIDFSKIEEGFLSCPVFCYASSRNEARSKLLAKIKWDGWKLKYEDEELTYLNIPVKRSTEYDKFEFEGKSFTKSEIDSLKRKRKRESELKEILNNPEIKYCYIRKHGMYYRPNSCGYTQYKIYAGIYEKAKAIKEAMSVQDLIIEVCYQTDHNNMILSQIEDLKNRLI